LTDPVTKRRIEVAIENAVLVLAHRNMSAEYVRGQVVALAADIERIVRLDVWDEDGRTPVINEPPWNEQRDSQRPTKKHARVPKGMWPKGRK